jgi:transglutaminase-like putative cysteine protease
VTFEVHTRAVLPPEDELTAQLVVPLKPDRELKRYLGKSPFIQTGDRSLKKVSREIFDKLAADPVEQETTDSADQSELPVEEGTPAETAEVSAAAEETGDDESAVVEIADAQLLAEPTPWQQVEAIYNYVEDNIKYVEGDDKSAVETLRDGQGDCQNISALMVGLCRTNKIPARIVWVHEHNYFEFCLADAEGNLHWFPCESSGMRAFGEMPLPRVILQKGDSFRVPEKPRETLRYASNFATAQGLPGSGKPRITYVGEKL